MKRLLLTGACLLISTPAFADIPVIDFSNIAIAVKEYTQDIASYALQAKQYATENLMWIQDVQAYALQGQQYLALMAELKNFVHDPNLGEAMGLINAVGLGSALPVSPYALMGVVNGFNSIGAGGGFSLGQIAGISNALSGLSAGSYAANHVYLPNDGTWNSTQLINAANSNAGAQAAALAVYDDLQQHETVLRGLQDRAAHDTGNMKDVADTQSQIMVQQGWIASQHAKLASLSATYATQVQARQQRDDEQLAKSLDNQITEARAAGILQ